VTQLERMSNVILPDPAVVFVAGRSSGGHLASLAALTPNDPAFQPGFEHADTSVTAAISLYG
jgi:acetyl esterase/lipase